MWDSEDGPSEEQTRLASPGLSAGEEPDTPRTGPAPLQPSPAPLRTSPAPLQPSPAPLRTSPAPLQPPGLASSAMTEEDVDEEEEEEEEEGPGDLLMSQPESRKQSDLQPSAAQEEEHGPGAPPLPDHAQTASSSLPTPEPEADLDPEPDGEGDTPGGTHPCPHCERHFSTKQGLERHAHIHAAAAGPQAHAFRCRYCGKSFGSQVGRRRHERRHENVAKKRPGSLAGTATLLGPAAPRGAADATGPDGAGRDGASGLYTAAGGFQIPVAPAQHADVFRKDPASDGGDRPFVVDENGESKELHPCKYCKKAFGTHTNMRRHQRRIHERHLLPKGVRRKGMLLQESPALPRHAAPPGASPGASPPPVYVPSADTEDEADDDVVDVSKNISENLSLYIDGKILSASAVSGCDVIEVDSGTAALLGLDAVIIGPGHQISQALKVDGRTGAVRHTGGGGLGPAAAKRRTSTPPLMPGLKMETETGSSSTPSPCSSASSSGLLVGGLFGAAASDGLAFPREKTVYLSPKLKQLLQTHDTPTLALLAERHRLASPLSVSALPGGPARFKRRTASPPSSPRLSPTPKGEGKGEPGPGSSYTLWVPKLEGYGGSAVWGGVSREEREAASSASDPRGGSSCNQQPLDLSGGAAGRRSEAAARPPGELVLDLSMHRKPATPAATEPEARVSPVTTATAAPPPTRKRKPNTSMLEKVLMNEYAGLAPLTPLTPLADDSSALGSPDSQDTAGSGTGSSSHSASPGLAPESAHPSPPSLTPVTLNPPSPGASSRTSPTPPPPVLPTAPSPSPAVPGSPPSDSLRSLPILSPKMSPRSVDHAQDEPPRPASEPASDAEDASLSEVERSDAEGGRDAAPQSPAPHPAPEDSPASLSEPGTARESVSPDPPSAESGVARRTRNSLLNGKVGGDSPGCGGDSPGCGEPIPVSLPSPTGASDSLAAQPDDPLASEALTAPLSKKVIKEEPAHTDVAPPPSAASPSPSPPPPDRPSHSEEEQEENSDAFSKSFVCNVCEQPFRSIPALSEHIVEHAPCWPYRCEFCVQLFRETRALLEHRAALHGVGRIFLCSACSKEFAFLCNLEQHQRDLHPGVPCTHAAVETGKLRPQNYTDPARAREGGEPGADNAPPGDNGSPSERAAVAKQEEEEAGVNGEHAAEDATEELYTTIKIMASEGGKVRPPDVRLGINQHYPSFKPPPFPYHNRAHASVASATNFTTHNIPQTFSTAIRCTKCGDGFDNMPELHKHILACANASDKRRYTPKKNPVPLRQIVKAAHNGALSPGSTAAAAAAVTGQSAFRRMGQPKRLNFSQEPAAGKTRMSSLSRKKNQLVQKAITQRNKTAASARKTPVKEEEEEREEQQQEVHVCPHCSREFTYPASLSKHVAVSCPLKPPAKKAKRGEAAASDKNMNLRKRAGDPEVQQPEPPPKTLGKTRARSSGAAEADAPPAGRGKAPGRPKRPASFPPAAPPLRKKGRKGQVHSPPATLPSSETPGEAAPRPAGRVGRVPKKGAEPRLPAPARKEAQGERFSLRARERAGGPVTRSLQMATAAAPPDPPASQDLREMTEAQPK